MPPLSDNTRAILLLTAPLIVGRVSETPKLLTLGEYKTLAQRLHDAGRQPADLLGPSSVDILDECKSFIDIERARRLLGRGLQLSQALERWQTRAIWVVSRADSNYPQRLKGRLRAHAPAVLYGCGELSHLSEGGLAIVGSRKVDDELFQYALDAGHLAASANRPVISGGAKGIDEAAMRGALEAGGRACGVLADSLEKKAMNRAHRNMIVEGQLTLVSPFDPSAGFNTGNAMQRNKVVYALADAALVVSSDVNSGGTWAGAIEQLEKFNHIRVYVRCNGPPSQGLNALRQHGAVCWPDPNAEDLQDLLDAPGPERRQHDFDMLGQSGSSEPEMELSYRDVRIDTPAGDQGVNGDSAPEPSARDVPSAADKLFTTVSLLIRELAQDPVKDADIADALRVPKSQAKAWLDRLVGDGVLEKREQPRRYIVAADKLL